MSDRYFCALGTASQVPTRDRNHNGYFLRWGKQGLLFDPGEGTQRQMIFAGLSAHTITKIFITHFHGDHCLGLSGILQRLSLDRVPHPVEVYYPAYGQAYFERLQTSSIYENRATIIPRPFTHEGPIFKSRDLIIETGQLQHTVESWGYRVKQPAGVSMLPAKLKALGLSGPAVGALKRNGSVEHNGQIIQLADVSEVKPGRAFAFVMDTSICEGAHTLAKDVDLLVCESTYLSDQTAEAIERGHMTAAQAAQVARDSGAKKLVLTHFSQRHPDTRVFVDEAQPIFENVVAVSDGDVVEF